MTRSATASANERRYGLAVFIGRFSPPHLGHRAVIEQALRVSESVLIAVGSANAARSFHYVPFTETEREQMIRLMLTPDENRRVHFVHVEDQGNMPKWTAQIRKAANEIEADDKRITLIGHSKDRSSYYLKGFRNWAAQDVDNYMNLSATLFRAGFFVPNREVLGSFTQDPLFLTGLHPEVIAWLSEFQKTPAFGHLIRERIKVQADREKYGTGPFVTGTSIVIHGDHVLLVKRGNPPFEDCWALPGGFVEADERIEDAIVRELSEETGLKVPELVLRRSMLRVDYWDNPWRDPRGRIIDFTGLFFLNPIPPANLTDPKEIAEFLKPPRVKGMDDAKKAEFVPIANVRRDQMAFDHYLQLMHALDYLPREI